MAIPIDHRDHDYCCNFYLIKYFMYCIIVDDDELSRMALKQCISRTENLELLAECSNANEAIEIIRNNKVDLIFLDIQMPEMASNEFIRNYKDLPHIIFVTIFKDYRAEAFDYNITDFLVKPFEFNRFTKSVNKARDINDNLLICNKGTTDIYIKKDGIHHKVDVKEINWIEALADYVNIYTINGRYTVLSTMKTIEQKLAHGEFARVHRSYIVRLDKIKEIEDNAININDNIIPISRSYKESLMKRLNLI
jgi:DNA-binding LytR/AlgR family response regulator